LYRVSFDLKTPDGVQVTVGGGYFQAPDEDVTVSLLEVLQQTGTPGVGITRGLQGLSAYEVAISNGFEGTESEWLTSLVAEIADGSITINKLGEDVALGVNLGASAVQPDDSRLTDERVPTDGSVTEDKLAQPIKDSLALADTAIQPFSDAPITASYAVELATARAINGVDFDGTADITITDDTKVPTTRTVNGHALSADVTVTQSDIGLGSVDDTSDADKPISTATQTALDGKAPTTRSISAGTGLTGGGDLSADRTLAVDFGTTSGKVVQGNDSRLSDTRTPTDGTVTTAKIVDTAVTLAKLSSGVQTSLGKADTALQSVTKADVGLGNAENTSDLSKPISTATQTALDAKQPLDSDLTDIAALAPANDSLIQRKSGVWVARTMAQLKTDLALTKSDVGLGSADNVADASKSVFSAATLTTARTIDGKSFDGSANIVTHAAQAVAPAAYVSGNYYYCSSAQTAATGSNLGNGVVRVSAWPIVTAVTIVRLFAEFSVAGEANSVFRIGIWNDDGNNRPGTLALDAGRISTGSGNAGDVTTGGTPGVYEITVSKALSPGLYWVGGAVQAAASSQPTMRTTTTTFFVSPLGTSLPSANQQYQALQFSQSGAFATASSITPAGGAPRIGFKVS
jgi:hypothetical protein